MSALLHPQLQVVPKRRCLKNLTPKELSLLTSMHAATIDGFRQVYGVNPSLFMKHGQVASLSPWKRAARWTHREVDSLCKSRTLFAGTQRSMSAPVNCACTSPFAALGTCVRRSSHSCNSVGDAGGMRRGYQALGMR
jgi:hypothetical protein